MQNPCDLLIVSFFSRTNVGFLDYTYRIKSLLGLPNSIVLSNVTRDMLELSLNDEKFVYLPGNKESFKEIFVYLAKVASVMRQLKPQCVVLLHSLLSLLAPLIFNSSKVLYWNEHPLHMYPEEAQGGMRSAKRAKNRFLRGRFYTGARATDIVMPIGEAMREDLLANGCRPERVKMMYMGVDQRFLPSESHKRSSGGDQRRTLDVIYTGSIHRDRGRDVMLRAIAEANSEVPKVRLTLVGADEEQYAYCHGMAVKMGIDQNVQVVRRIKGSIIPSMLHAADAGICIWANKPHWRFNPPTKLFEYLTAGLPVLASRIETHTRYVKEGETGLIFDYDSHSLAGAFDRLWRNQAKLPQMRARALEDGKRYLWDGIEPFFVETVRTLIENGGHGR